MESSHRSSICPDIPSEPEAVFGFKFRTKQIISSLLIEIWSILLSVRNYMGNELLLVISLHCFGKKSLKTFALSLQFEINTLFTRRGGILGALHLFITLLIIFQYDFWEVLGSFTLFPKLVR